MLFENSTQGAPASRPQPSTSHQNPPGAQHSLQEKVSVGSTGVGQTLANATATFGSAMWTTWEWTAPVAQWVASSSYSGLSSACTYGAPLVKTAAELMYSAVAAGAEGVRKPVTDYLRGDQHHETEALEMVSLERGVTMPTVTSSALHSPLPLTQSDSAGGSLTQGQEHVQTDAQRKILAQRCSTPTISPFSANYPGAVPVAKRGASSMSTAKPLPFRSQMGAMASRVEDPLAMSIAHAKQQVLDLAGISSLPQSQIDGLCVKGLMDIIRRQAEKDTEDAGRSFDLGASPFTQLAHETRAQRAWRLIGGLTSDPLDAASPTKRLVALEQLAMTLAGVSTLTQSYLADGTLAKGLEHILDESEDKFMRPTEGLDDSLAEEPAHALIQLGKKSVSFYEGPKSEDTFMRPTEGLDDSLAEEPAHALIQLGKKSVSFYEGPNGTPVRATLEFRRDPLADVA